MTRLEHLLTTFVEECGEVAQRATKALRFGIAEIQPEQNLSNAERIRKELADLWAVKELLESQTGLSLHPLACDVEAKKAKVEQFLHYSETCGTLTQASQSNKGRMT